MVTLSLQHRPDRCNIGTHSAHVYIFHDFPFPVNFAVGQKQMPLRSRCISVSMMLISLVIPTAKWHQQSLQDLLLLVIFSLEKQINTGHRIRTINFPRGWTWERCVALALNGVVLFKLTKNIFITNFLGNGVPPTSKWLVMQWRI